MRNKANFLLATVLTCCLFAMGCKEVQVSNGEVPSEYLTLASQYAGTYEGLFDGKPARIDISFEGNTPVLSYSDTLGTDILNPACQSKILKLKEISVEESNVDQYELTQAIFDFYPNQCGRIIGKSIHLDFKDKNTIKVSYLHHNKKIGRSEPRPVYVSGTFTKR